MYMYDTEEYFNVIIESTLLKSSSTIKNTYYYR